MNQTSDHISLAACFVSFLLGLINPIIFVVGIAIVGIVRLATGYYFSQEYLDIREKMSEVKEC